MNTILHYIKGQNRRELYKLICHTCKLVHGGQTGRNIKTHFNEHCRYIQTNNPKSAYALHILNKIKNMNTDQHVTQLR